MFDCADNTLVGFDARFDGVRALLPDESEFWNAFPDYPGVRSVMKNWAKTNDAVLLAGVIGCPHILTSDLGKAAALRRVETAPDDYSQAFDHLSYCYDDEAADVVECPLRWSTRQEYLWIHRDRPTEPFMTWTSTSDPTDHLAKAMEPDFNRDGIDVQVHDAGLDANGSNTWTVWVRPDGPLGDRAAHMLKQALQHAELKQILTTGQRTVA